MSWTQGQPNRYNQSPFIDPNKERRGNPNQRSEHTKKEQVIDPSNAAATFTQEGLETFATIFASSVQAAITNALPRVIEQVLDTRLVELKSSLENELHRIIADTITRVVQSKPETDLDSCSGDEQDARNAYSQEHVEQTPTPNRHHEEELRAILNALKTAGRPVAAQELRALTGDKVAWGSNPSMTLGRFINWSNGQIAKVRRGFYKYNA